MGVAKNHWLSGFVANLIGIGIGLVILAGVRWVASVNIRMAALESRPPVVREYVSERLRNITAADLEEMMKQHPADDSDDESDCDLPPPSF